jgi:hypothetical protein
MKIKIIQDTYGQFKIFNRILFMWISWYPEYNSLDDCYKAIFRVDEVIPVKVVSRRHNEISNVVIYEVECRRV